MIVLLVCYSIVAVTLAVEFYDAKAHQFDSVKFMCGFAIGVAVTPLVVAVIICTGEYKRTIQYNSQLALRLARQQDDRELYGC